MMSLLYPLNHYRLQLNSPALILPLCLGASLLAASVAHSQVTRPAPPNYSDLDESTGLYDTLPHPSDNLQNNVNGGASGSASEAQRLPIVPLPSASLPAMPLPAQKPQEKNLRNLIRGLGVHSRDVQDMVIAHITTEMQFREPMRNASSRLFQAMNKPGFTDTQLSVLLNDCRVAYETDKVRRSETLDALKFKIGPDLTPRIESMLFLLGLEGDVVITLPTPTLLTQMQREQQRLLKVVDGLKLEADSLRRERDDAKAEFQAYQVTIQAGNAGNAKAPVNVVASAQINPHGLYAAPDRDEKNAAQEQKELSRLAEENAELKKNLKRLQREKNGLSRALKRREDRDAKRAREKSEKEAKNKLENTKP